MEVEAVPATGAWVGVAGVVIATSLHVSASDEPLFIAGCVAPSGGGTWIMNAVVCRVADDLPLSITSSSVRETDDSGEFVPLFASSIPSGEPPSSWTLRPRIRLIRNQRRVL